MSRSRNRSIRTHWRSTLIVTDACIAWCLAVPSAAAQESEPPVLVASLSLSTMPPEFILDSVRERPARPAPQLIVPTDRPIPGLHRKPTDADAWEKFEAEYRPEKRNPSLMKRPIEAAKYGLDVSTFAVDRFVKSIRDHADFEFAPNGFRRTCANARGDFLDNPRVKLDLDLTHARPYLGVRVVIPFGN
jgi:hypothetical protein